MSLSSRTVRRALRQQIAHLHLSANTRTHVPLSRFTQIVSQHRQASSNTPKETNNTAPTNTSQSSFAAKKSAQEDRTHIDRQSYEYSGSGTDDAVSDLDNIPYDRNASNDPEESSRQAGKQDSGSNPLEVSAANPKVSTEGTGVDYVTKAGGPTSTYSGHGRGKEKTQSKGEGTPANRTYAGFDKRKPQGPGGTANQAGTLSPGTR